MMLRRAGRTPARALVRALVPLPARRALSAPAIALAAALEIALALAASDAAAQSFVSMGRLFTTSSERAQLDQARTSGAALPGGTGGPAGIGGAGATSTGAAIAPMTGAGGTSGAAAYGPCATGQGAAGSGTATMADAGGAAGVGGTGGSGSGGGSGAAGGMPGCGDAAGAGAVGATDAVRLSGMIRRSNGRTTVFVNDEAQDGRAVNQGRAARVNAAGRTVILKPGQSYDPATGAINEADR